jgi:fatty-acyl-CoA synthase
MEAAPRDVPTDGSGLEPPDDATLCALLRTAAEDGPDRPAVVAGPERWTYGRLATETVVAARALRSLGVGEGDTVALLAPNTAAWIPTALGAMQCGARVDAFHTWVKAYDLDHLLRASAASVLVMVDAVRSSDLTAELVTLLPELRTHAPGQWRSARYPALRHVVVMGATVPPGATAWERVRADRSTDAAADETWPGLEADQADRPAFVLYTSGSTRYPKAVPLVHRDLIVNGFHIGARMGLTSDDRVWLTSPLFWSFGAANALMAVLTHRACLVLQERFTPRAAVAMMADEGVTAAYLLPSIAAALADEVAEQVRAVETLRTGLTIGRADEVRCVVEDLGIDGICNVYGSTETYGNCCVTPHDAPLSDRLSSQGPPLPGDEVRTVDPATMTPLAPGVAGELQVRGRVMPGYLGDPVATAQVMTPDGWYRTGDRAVIRHDGSVQFVARLDDMIKTSGINVSPAEVEGYLTAHPLVAEAVVIGAPHPTRGQVPVAFVVPASPAVTVEDLVRFCRGGIAGYKVPHAIQLLTDLPRTGPGKVRRRDLVEEAGALVRRDEQSTGPEFAGTTQRKRI